MTHGEPEPALRAEGITVAYHRATVLRDADLTVYPGSITGIVGPNGAGKSTLMKATLGLAPVLRGRALFFGKPLAQVRDRVAYMPQAVEVDWDFPTTVGDVVEMGTYGRLGWFRWPGRAQHEATDRALELTGITHIADQPIGELSGGQRQRMLLARTLVQEPKLCLLDEPFQGVDAASQRDISAVLEHLRDEGIAVLLIHHDLETVRGLCDRVTIVNRDVIATGSPDEVLTAATIASAYGVMPAEPVTTPRADEEPLAP